MSNEEITYLNYAATSFPKSKVALKSFYKNICSLPSGVRHHGPDSLGALKDRVGNILQVDSASLFFTESATIGLNQVIRGFSKESYSVAIDNRSHNAVVRPWRTLAEPLLATIYDEKDCLVETNLIQMLAKAPDLFVLTHVSNVSGSIYPIERVIQLIRSFSPSTAILVDASQSAGAIPLHHLRLADFAV
ncbi:MAG: aminotransferase class V-fold PLP-dependent enzyme, partial [Chlamydiae bacterium]|nr:aminotransferase class V-fold PLP-dependent enzyme [Chlamydiota bacterium]